MLGVTMNLEHQIFGAVRSYTTKNPFNSNTNFHYGPFQKECVFSLTFGQIWDKVFARLGVGMDAGHLKSHNHVIQTQSLALTGESNQFIFKSKKNQEMIFKILGNRFIVCTDTDDKKQDFNTSENSDGGKEKVIKCLFASR